MHFACAAIRLKERVTAGRFTWAFNLPWSCNLRSISRKAWMTSSVVSESFKSSIKFLYISDQSLSAEAPSKMRVTDSAHLPPYLKVGRFFHADWVLFVTCYQTPCSSIMISRMDEFTVISAWNRTHVLNRTSRNSMEQKPQVKQVSYCCTLKNDGTNIDRVISPFGHYAIVRI